MELYYMNDRNDNFKLGQYQHDSLDKSNNKYKNSSKKKRREKRQESDKEKPSILPSILFLRLVKVSQNKVAKVKLHIV